MINYSEIFPFNKGRKTLKRPTQEDLQASRAGLDLAASSAGFDLAASARGLTLKRPTQEDLQASSAGLNLVASARGLTPEGSLFADASRSLLLLLIISSCNETTPINPFDGQVVSQDTVRLEIINPEPNSIAGIYQNILKPTCANSGCHDGTFEPDYRTLESAYNTLVYQVPIKNNGSYTYRVDPYNPQTSVLMARLNNLITPAMPIQIEPDSDWPLKKNEYINNIQTWIGNGAPDIMGNVRQINYPAPELLGAGASEASAWMPRSGGTGPLVMPVSASDVRLYFAFHHDELMSEELQYNRIAFSANPDAFETADELPLQILASPRNERGFYGDIVAFTHYIDINPAAEFDPEQQQWYFRVYVQDDQNPVTEIPTDNGIYYLKSYMSFRWAQ